jgi:hypothetical protein
VGFSNALEDHAWLERTGLVISGVVAAPGGYTWHLHLPGAEPKCRPDRLASELVLSGRLLSRRSDVGFGVLRQIG